MVKALAEKVFDVIEAESARLREVTASGRSRQRITDAWPSRRSSARSWSSFTAMALEPPALFASTRPMTRRRPIHDREPYRLARDIRGIGFKTADAIAMKLGIEKTAIIRLRTGISYTLTGPRTRSLRAADG